MSRWPPAARAGGWAAGAVALLLSACGALPAHQATLPALAVPAAWSADAAGAPADPAALADWWRHFDDPLLGTLVAQALQANPGIDGARAALRQARALRDVAAAGLSPTLAGSAGAQRSQAGLSDGSNRFTAGLDAGWELDVFGGRRSALAAADATTLASAASLGDGQVSIAAEVALALIALRGAQVRGVIAEANLASQQETLQITRWRLQAGLVDELAAEQALAAAELTRASIPPLRATALQTAHALAVLTGQPPAALLPLLAVPHAVPQPSTDLALSLPADTLRQRPDVRAAEHRLRAEWARLAQADAARLPRFTLSGSLGLGAATLGALGQGASVLASLAAGMAAPLIDGGALRAQVRAQQAVLDQAGSTWQAAVLRALQEVEDALAALRADRERLLRLQGAASAAGNAATLARQRYGSGLVDFQTVLDTQRSQLGTQDSVAVAQAAVSADHVRLYKALGGGWRPDGGFATAAVPPSSDARIPLP